TGETVEHFYRVWLTEVRERADQLPKVVALDGHSRLLDTPLEATLGGRMSPDGRFVAVYGVPDWEQPIPGLYLMPAEGGRLRKVAGNLDLYDSWRLSWSPDSQTLAFVGRVADGSGSVRDAVFLHDLESRRTRRLKTGGTRVFEAEFSPDGRQLAVTAYRGEHAMIAVMNRDGSDLQFVTHQLAGDCFSPTWSPDGTRLAFSLTDAEGVDIAVIRADGSGFERLTHDAWPDQYPTWGARGIVFSSYRPVAGSADRGDAAVAAEAEGIAGAATNAYLIAPDGGAPRQLTEATTGGVFYPSFTADGTGLLVSLYKVRTAELRVVDLSGATAQAPAEAAAVETAGVPVPDLRTVEPNTVKLASADAAAVQPRAAAPSPVAVATDPTAATGRRPGSAADTPAVRDYDGFAHVRPYVTRPFTDDDGLGDTIGMRTRMTDPLHQHEVSAEASYGLGSDRLGWQVAYRNDQTAWRTAINFFRRVPPVRAERGVLVADSSIGTEVLAELPISFGNPYAKDRFKLGFEYADHSPFKTAGGVLVPPPIHAVVCGPSIGWERNQIFPAVGSQHLEAKLTQSLRALGAQISFTTGTLAWNASLFAPNPRMVLGTAANLYYFEGRDFSRSKSQQLASAAELRYDWRVGDQFLSRYTWPYLHIGPTYLSASYQLRSLLKGNGSGLDLRDSAEIGLTNRGYLSRQGEYQLQLVERWFLGGGSRSEFLALLRFQWRDLPF
ncbi:MAG: PD40 domain-containing protein, partial [Armatimonadetes bacterium]|nr:PD40 domain-containing protein [Armatimonadota bacterium]